MKSSALLPSFSPSASRRGGGFVSLADWRFNAGVSHGRPSMWISLIRQTGNLDWEYIRAQLRPLAELKHAPEILDQLEDRRAQFEQ